MKVLGHRVAIAPDAQPTAQGELVLPQDRYWVPTSGTVIALGVGSKARQDARRRALRDALRELEAHGQDRALACVRRLLDTPDAARDIQIGDRVAFDSDTGLLLEADGESVLILHEDDVVVIVQEAETAA